MSHMHQVTTVSVPVLCHRVRALTGTATPGCVRWARRGSCRSHVHVHMCKLLWLGCWLLLRRTAGERSSVRLMGYTSLWGITARYSFSWMSLEASVPRTPMGPTPISTLTCMTAVGKSLLYVAFSGHTALALGCIGGVGGVGV